jgi:uracil-DNA glycosylase
MIGPVVHGPALVTPLFLLGQAPGPHEGKIGKPFAWTAGKTLFAWFIEHLGAPEALVRERVYFAAVARCFPGKAAGGGDRKPDRNEIAACRDHLAREVVALRPEVVIPVGQLAIEQVLGRKAPLAATVGEQFRTEYLGARVDVVPLPHPSGVSTWHRTPIGKAKLAQAFAQLAAHPAVRAQLL